MVYALGAFAGNFVQSVAASAVANKDTLLTYAHKRHFLGLKDRPPAILPTQKA